MLYGSFVDIVEAAEEAAAATRLDERKGIKTVRSCATRGRREARTQGSW
jgi:hypothetical protein